MFLHESNYSIWCYGNTVADATVLGSTPSWMSYDCKGASDKIFVLCDEHVRKLRTRY